MRRTRSSSTKKVSRGELDGCHGGVFELVEVVVGRLDLGVVEDLVAEPEEDVLDLAADLGDQVQVAARDLARRAA